MKSGPRRGAVVDALSNSKSSKRLRASTPSQPGDEKHGHVECFRTDYDYDEDLVNTTKFSTPRKRVQKPFRFVASHYHDKTTPNVVRAWLTKTGNESVALTGQHSTTLSKVEDMGPFKTHMYELVTIIYFE